MTTTRGGAARAAAFFIALILPAYLCVAAPQPDAADRLADAWTALQVRNYPRAAELFREALQGDPGSTVTLRARLGQILVIRYNPDRFNRAACLAQLGELLKQVPSDDTDLRALVMFQIAECSMPPVQASKAEKQKLRDAMVAELGDIISTFPGTRHAALAASDSAFHLMNNDPEGNAQRALDLLNRTLAETHDTSATAILYQALANQHLLMGHWADAEHYFNLWFDTGLETEWLRAAVLYTIATLNQNELKRPARAAELYERIARDYPYYNFSSEAHRRAQLLVGGSAARMTSPTAEVHP